MVNDNSTEPENAEAPKKRSRRILKPKVDATIPEAEKPRRGRLRKEVAAPRAAEAHVNAADATEDAAEQAAQQQQAVVETPEAAQAQPAAVEPVAPVRRPTTSLFFQAPPMITLPEDDRPERGDRPERAERAPRERNDRQPRHERDSDQGVDESGTVRRRSRRRPGEEPRDGDDAPNTVVRVRQPRPEPVLSNEPTRVKGSTRLEAKKQRRRDGRDAGRRRPVITESEFLARRESVDRVMVVRSKHERIQIAVLEDGVLVEHYVAKSQDMSLIGNVYLGRVQNVLPSMEAAFVDIGRGRNAVLYSGEVDWDAAAAESSEGKNQARRIELALKPGDKVLVQVTKDPVGHKGARLTSQVSLPGRYLVYVPNGSMNGISRKLPDTERARLKKILKEVLPENVGVIVRTAAEGATEDQLTLDVQRLTSQWAEISRLVETANSPALLHSEPDLLVKIIRDVFNEDFHKLVISGSDAQDTIESYLRSVAPDLIDRVQTFEGTNDPFDEYRVNEQIEKALDRKVWLPSGGSLVIDRTEAMTVVDVNTGKFVGSGGNLEETVTKNNLEAAEEIVRQLRLRDIGGIIVVDFIDMVLEMNRDLVLRRLVECLSRDRTKHQVAEVTSLGLVQMTRKKLGLGLLETFSEPCEVCAGRGVVVHHEPVNRRHVAQTQGQGQSESGTGRRSRGGKGGNGNGNGSSNNSQQPPRSAPINGGTHAITDDVRNALARVAASTVHADHEAHAAEVAAHEDPTLPDVRVEIPELPDAQHSQSEVKTDEPTQLEESAAKLDLPAKKERAPRRARAVEADDLLGSVLEALPEPKQPGQGRSRVSRRAGSAGAIVSAPISED